VFESGVPKRIFGPKREEVAGGWKGVHNEELRNLNVQPYYLGDHIKEDEMLHTWERWEMHAIFWLERPLVRPRHRWEDNIRTGLREIQWEGVD
jgi:hypothetical protein